MKHVSRWTAGDGGAYSPSHRGAGQVLKKTGRDRLTPSTAVRLQDGRTAPLRTLADFVVWGFDETPKSRGGAGLLPNLGHYPIGGFLCDGRTVLVLQSSLKNPSFLHSTSTCNFIVYSESGIIKHLCLSTITKHGQQ